MQFLQPSRLYLTVCLLLAHICLYSSHYILYILGLGCLLHMQRGLLRLMHHTAYTCARLHFDFLTAQCVPYVPFVLHMISASEFVITQLHDFAAWSLHVSALRPGATPGRPVLSFLCKLSQDGHSLTT